MLTEIVQNITGSFTDVTTSMTSAISQGFSALLWETSAEGTRTLSSLAQFGLVFIGVGLAIGLVYFVARLIRR